MVAYASSVGRIVSDQSRVAINESVEHAVVIGIPLWERDSRLDEFVAVLLVVNSIGAHIVVDYVEELGALLDVQVTILDVREVGLGPNGPLVFLSLDRVLDEDICLLVRFRGVELVD